MNIDLTHCKNNFIVRPLIGSDIEGTVLLQRACFPAPFPEELLWKSNNLANHLKVFPAGQFVATYNGQVIGSASNLLISEERWQAHAGWEDTVGGFDFLNYDPHGTTLYGADISVHPDFRKIGVARALYQKRFEVVVARKLQRYGTACRIPDFAANALREKQSGQAALSTTNYCR